MEYKICGADKKDHTPCKLPAGYGTDHPGFGHCRFHYGNTYSGKVAAAKVELAEVADRVGMTNARAGVTAEQIVMEELSRSAGAVAYFDAMVAQIEPDMLDSPQASTLMAHWNTQRGMLANLSMAMIKAGLEERAVRVAEGQATALVAAVMAVLTDEGLGLAPEQVQAGRRLMADRLRALGAGTVEAA